MAAGELTGILAIVLAAVLAPLIADRINAWISVPSVIFEICLGVIIGPVVLGWVDVDEVISQVAQFGLAVLMFMAGYEIEFRRIHGRPLRTATIGWLISLVAGIALGTAISGFTLTALVVGLALTTTALGTMLPIIRDSGALPTKFGAQVMAIGTLGEFGPIVAVALVFSHDVPWHTLGLIVLFAAIAVGAAHLATRPRHPRLAALITATLGTSAQVAVRLIMFIIIAMLWIAERFGLDILLGAFAAGIVVRLSMDAASRKEETVVEAKMDAIGFGFLIPFFFVVSGVNLDLPALAAQPASLLLIPLFLGLFLLVRGLPTYLLHRRDEHPRALAVFASAGLPLIVVITSAGVENKAMTTSTAAAMVTAGVLSVLIFPLVGLKLYQRSAVPVP